MPTYYKREIADLNGTGEKQYRYEVRSAGNDGLEDLARNLRQSYRAIGTSEVVGIFNGVIRALAEALADGRTVSIEGLGSFSLSLGVREYSENTRSGEQQGEANASRIYVRGVNVRVSPELVRTVNGLCRGRFRREAGGAVTIRQPRGTREQRIGQALALIREQGYMRLADYARLMQISMSTASRELKTFCQDPTIPICTQGRGPSRLFVEAKTERQDTN